MLSKTMYRIIGIVLLFGIGGSVLFSESTPAAEWADYYLQAQKAAQQKKWDAAIDLYLKAIEADPNPSPAKRHGMKKIPYYPYIELGMAYIAIGDIEAAHQYCTLSRERKVAPQKTVDQCLNMTARFLQKNPKTHPSSDSNFFRSSC